MSAFHTKIMLCIAWFVITFGNTVDVIKQDSTLNIITLIVSAIAFMACICDALRFKKNS